MQNKNNIEKKAYTLIELLMVMSIIGAMAGVFLFRYPAIQRRARDAQRKSDIQQYFNQIEIHANNNDGFYYRRTASGGIPLSDVANKGQGSWTLCTDLGLNLSNSQDCVSDPKDGQLVCGDGNDVCRYMYQSNNPGCAGGAACSTQFVLWAPLEQPVSGDYWVVCSGGQKGEVSNTTFPTVLGKCPI